MTTGNSFLASDGQLDKWPPPAGWTVSNDGVWCPASEYGQEGALVDRAPIRAVAPSVLDSTPNYPRPIHEPPQPWLSDWVGQFDVRKLVGGLSFVAACLLIVALGLAIIQGPERTAAFDPELTSAGSQPVAGTDQVASSIGSRPSGSNDASEGVGASTREAENNSEGPTSPNESSDSGSDFSTTTSTTPASGSTETTTATATTPSSQPSTARTDGPVRTTNRPSPTTTELATTTVPTTPFVTPSPTVCNPNYSPCIFNGSDVDCRGGGGDGPRFVAGPVQVLGADIWDLDADNNGIGCEARPEPSPSPTTTLPPSTTTTAPPTVTSITGSLSPTTTQ